MINAPAFSPVLILLLFGSLRINVFEESFLLFAAHPLAMTAAAIAFICFAQVLSERNIRTLEFEFF